jgi:uncharacterized protein YdeI (YjbR/CyaY-like superfamily)
MRIKTFKTPDEFRAWLTKNHASAESLGVRIFKKDSGRKSITYAEALEEALCFGWIDGQKVKGDEEFWVQKFTPRRPRSSWSKINCGHALRLIKEGRMKSAGLKEIEEAKRDGRWAAAYDSHRTMKIPSDFITELKKNKKAAEFFDTLNRTNLYSIAYRLQTAKRPETRVKRMKSIIEMLSKGRTFH